MRQRLDKSQGASEIKEPIGAAKFEWDHRPRQNNRFVCGRLSQCACRFLHRIGSMCDDDLVLLTPDAVLEDCFPIRFGHLKAVDHHKSADIEFYLAST